MSKDAANSPVDGRSKWSWPTRIVLGLVIVFVIYPVSMLPFALVMMWLVEFGVMTEPTGEAMLLAIYAPVIRAVEAAPALERLLESIASPFERLAPK